MKANLEFVRRPQMNSCETVLLEKCPLCREATVIVKKTSRVSFLKHRIGVCPRCRAEFEAVGADRYRLVFCEPHRLMGKHNCAERILRGCYLDAVLSKQDWQQIAGGGESPEVSKSLEDSVVFNRGDLPVYEGKNLPFVLEDGEVVHYVSSSVYLDDQKPSRRNRSDEGTFYLTNRRMLYVGVSASVAIRFSSVERIEECPPGFLVQEKDAFEPHYFFPSRLEPAFAAVTGAMRNLKKEGLGVHSCLRQQIKDWHSV